MTRSDDEAILARNTCDFYGGKYCSIVGSLHSMTASAVQRLDRDAIASSIQNTCVLGAIVSSSRLVTT
jgi:hypothetical protein